ncbi:MAG: N-acetyltransferase family protein [Gammaproteobacteria bacterium]
MTHPPELTIRPATPADVPAILKLIVELAEFEQLTHLLTATEATLHEGLFGFAPGCEALVGVADGEVVAYALFFHNYSTFLARKGLYLEDLYVQQAQRGKGYGKALLVAVARLAVQRGCGRFEWTVLDWNENAIRFYQGMGADVMPDWRVCRVAGDALAQLAEQ